MENFKISYPSPCVQVPFKGCGFLQLQLQLRHLQRRSMGMQRLYIRQSEALDWETGHTHITTDENPIFDIVERLINWKPPFEKNEIR